MKVGDLVTVRIDSDRGRKLSTGVIVSIYMGQERLLYEVLSKGRSFVMTDMDLGPIHVLEDRDRLEKRWNEETYEEG